MECHQSTFGGMLNLSGIRMRHGGRCTEVSPCEFEEEIDVAGRRRETKTGVLFGNDLRR